MSDLEGVLRKPAVLIPALIVLFLVSFAVPIFFALSASDIIGTPEDEVQDELSEGSVPTLLSVASRQSFLKVAHNPALQVEEGKDFVFVSWLRFKKFPELQQNVMAIAKFEPKRASKNGYTIGIGRDEDSVHPIVYWRDRKGRGGLYRFASMPFVPKTWILLAISFQKNRFLGAHAGLLSPSGEVELHRLGGHPMETPLFAQSEGDLLIGAEGDGPFRGKVGPQAIFSGEGLIEDLEDILNGMLHAPNELPSELSQDQVMLWVDGSDLKDASEFQHVVEHFGSSETRRKKKGK